MYHVAVSTIRAICLHLVITCWCDKWLSVTVAGCSWAAPPGFRTQNTCLYCGICVGLSKFASSTWGHVRVLGCTSSCTWSFSNICIPLISGLFLLLYYVKKWCIYWFSFLLTRTGGLQPKIVIKMSALQHCRSRAALGTYQINYKNIKPKK
jgi:hypothetical protein